MHTAGITYRSFIPPVLDYCDTVRNCCGLTNTDNVEKLKTNSSGEALAHLIYNTLELRPCLHGVGEPGLVG